MQAIPRWRSLLILKNLLIQSTEFASTSKPQLASFHSTRVIHEKWKSNWASGSNKWTTDENSSKIPSKDYITYKSRQKRADAKKALNDLLFNSGSSYIPSEDETLRPVGAASRTYSIFSSFDFNRKLSRFFFLDTKEPYSDTETLMDGEVPLGRRDRSKSSPAGRRAAKAVYKRMKRKFKREKLHDDSDGHENVFQESFRKLGSKWSYWSAREPFYKSTTAGFDSGGRSKWGYRKQRESDIESEPEPEPDTFYRESESESEPDTEPCAYGETSVRQVLDLPLKGPLKIQDVKNAFRLSALKWHPDKHQGPSQAMAEEKFKLCVDAYKTLCNSLSAA